MGRQTVAIIGGGIGGLTTALALLRQGVDCAVYERAPELHEIGSGVGLWPNAMRVLDRVGVGDDVRALSGQWAISGVRNQAGALLNGFSVTEYSQRFGEPLVGVHRGELQMTLKAALPDGVLHTGRECVGVEATGDRVKVRFVDGDPVVAPVVIAADGIRSVIRRSLFVDKPLRDLGMLGWRATLVDPPDTGGFTGEIWGNGASFGFLPMGSNRLSWFGGADGDPPRTKEFLAERFAEWHAPIPELIERTDESMIWFDRLYDTWPRRHWVKGRVALLGDAAHPMSPFLGMGACQAILDAWVVAEELARTTDDVAGLMRYQRRRWPLASAVQLAAHGGVMSARPRPNVVQPLFETSLRIVPKALMLRGLTLLGRGV
ncbi:MAG TPA: FAD-dependent oxidoreductase [Acidimicrobiales bacterium]|nr:FAD-dependent oxidoreductase [Acidimicrobiales bacterium]